MARKRIGCRKLTGAERVQRSVEIGNEISERLTEARKSVNWSRRDAAEKSLSAWFSEYCVGIFADSAPDGHLPEALEEMERAIGDSRPYQICMARGHGKTTLTEGAAAYSFATGRRKYLVIIGANLHGAKTIFDDIFRLFTSDKFAQDYPDLAVPILASNGSYRRRITFQGKPCDIEKNATNFVAPTIYGDDGEPVPTSGSVMIAVGFGAGIRGKKRGALRPDMAFLDDIQTDDVAANHETVDKYITTIRKSVLNLGGKKKIACMMTATVIEPDDLAARICDDKSWKTTFFKAFQKWPSDWIRHPKDGLWSKYFEMYDRENNRDESHRKSLAFYRKNKKQMDEGADVLSPMNFKREDGHISAIQKLMDKMHEIKMRAFAAEYQMTPDVGEYALNIRPKDVLAKVTDSPKLVIPPGFTFVTAGTDINVSYALTTTITAFKPDTTAHVIYHEVYPCAIDSKLPEKAFYTALFNKLDEYASHISSLGVMINVWGIDCNGQPMQAVTDFAKACRMRFGINAVGMRGAASVKYNPLSRGRLANDINRTIWIGDAKEQALANSGRRWLWWDSDLYRELVHRSLLAKSGSAGGMTLYESEDSSRDDFAIQVTNERLEAKRELGDGRVEYRWKTNDPHDWLDSTAESLALAAHYGISVATQQRPSAVRQKAPMRRTIVL